MKVNRLILSMLLVVFCISGLLGCGVGDSKNKVVAFVPQTLNAGAFWDDISTNLKKELEANGFSYESDAPEKWGADLQAEVINKFIDEKVDAIIVAPAGTSELFESFKRAEKAGVKIILVDTDISKGYLASYGTKVTSFVGVDNYKGGQEVGKEVAKELPKNSEVAIFSGGVENANSEDRCNGFSDAVKEQGMTVEARNSVPEWTAEDAYLKAKQVFKAYPNIKAVFTADGNICKGVYKAAEECSVNIIGGSFDADDEMINKIENGKIVCAFDQDSKAMSKKVAEVVKMSVDGKDVDRVTNSEGKLITK